jgi:hypothetical protein
MTIKVFISYSHKDEQHKDSLDEHLSMLKHNKTIDAWHDRKIIPGTDWSNEISSNLSSADLILFLISPSFLASDYCFNIEANKAIELHEAGRAQLIPILLRPCDWSSSKFAKFQAVPKDALPITKWENIDEAWLDAINGIKRHIAKFTPSTKSSSVTTTFAIEPSQDVLTWIDDTEVVLTHRKVDKIKLCDVYVWLDIELAQTRKQLNVSIENSENLFKNSDQYLIYGEEQQGKTSLLKNIYKDLLKKGVAPIYIDANDIKRSDLEKVISTSLEKQYKNISLPNYLKLSNKAILIDNLHDIGLNARFRGTLLAEINRNFEHIVITCNPSFSYILPEIIQLDNYKKFELLGLGHQKRQEIVEKWVSLGVEESIGEQELYSQCDEIKARLDAIIRKNIVPAKPIYILMFLQMFEAYAQQNLELSSHGHCYQQLIYQAFDHAKIPKKETDKYLNVLTELAWLFYKNGGAINQYALEQFFIDYEKTYLSVDGKNIIDRLKSNGILVEQNSKIQFKYPYLYYFFAAKKIAESFSTAQDTQVEVNNLISNLHREDYANILVFVTHHTKDSWVLEKIQIALNSLFSDQIAANLSNDQLKFMGDFIGKIPELVMEQREIKDEREKFNKKLDEIDKISEQDEFESNDILANINKTFKGMEISGQIIRNRHATLTRNSLYTLANEGILSGLRFLNFFIGISDTAKLEVIKFISLKLRENPDLSNSEVQDYAKDIFLQLTYGVINGVIRKIASSIGSNEASEVYASIQKNSPSPAITLLNQAIELQFKRNLDILTVSQTASELNGNPVCKRILKEMVIQHTYMFPVGYKEKQQLAELLGMSVQGQHLMDRKKLGKG